MSRIEQIITEIEDYIDSCKFQPLSNTKILVNKEETGRAASGTASYAFRMRSSSIRRSSATRMRFCTDAHSSQADAMVAEATAQTNELVNEHEIMQRAYAAGK